MSSTNKSPLSKPPNTPIVLGTKPMQSSKKTPAPQAHAVGPTLTGKKIAAQSGPPSGKRMYCYKCGYDIHKGAICPHMTGKFAKSYTDQMRSASSHKTVIYDARIGASTGSVVNLKSL
jgi:hypothetical protein